MNKWRIYNVDPSRINEVGEFITKKYIDFVKVVTTNYINYINLFCRLEGGSFHYWYALSDKESICLLILYYQVHSVSTWTSILSSQRWSHIHSKDKLSFNKNPNAWYQISYTCKCGNKTSRSSGDGINKGVIVLFQNPKIQFIKFN